MRRDRSWEPTGPDQECPVVVSACPDGIAAQVVVTCGKRLPCSDHGRQS